MSRPKGSGSGAKDAIASLFKGAPDSEFDINRLRKSFSKVSDAMLFYYLRQLKDDGFLVQPKQGWYRYNKEFETIEQRQARALEAGKARVQQSNEGWKPMSPAITATDNRWKRYLEQQVKNIIARMKTDAPANRLFHEQDETLIQELLETALKA